MGSPGCCLLGSFKRATSFKFSPVWFIIIQSVSFSQIFQFAQISTNAVSFPPSVIYMPSVGIVKDLTCVHVRRGLLVMARLAKVKRITYNLFNKNVVLL